MEIWASLGFLGKQKYTLAAYVPQDLHGTGLLCILGNGILITSYY